MFEVLFVYALIQALIVFSHSINLVNLEKQTLGWSYSVPLVCFVIIPAIAIWLTRRNWAEYGVSLENWQTYLDVGVKAFLVRFIPDLFGRVGTSFLGLTARSEKLFWILPG